MNEQQKKEIKEALKQRSTLKGGYSKVAAELSISVATISNVMNDKWEGIANTMWRKLADKLNILKEGWQLAETRNFKILQELMAESQQHSESYALCIPAGCGKTETSLWYRQNHANVALVQCEEYFTKRDFLVRLSRGLGLDVTDLPNNQLLERIEAQALSLERPLIILDEFDKVSDQIVLFFVTLYNRLNGKCGLIMLSTIYMETRVKRGLRLHKKGYEEFYSRVGCKFITSGNLLSQDIVAICKANGITDSADIERVVHDCQGDGRRVKRKINAMIRSRKSEEKKMQEVENE